MFQPKRDRPVGRSSVCFGSSDHRYCKRIHKTRRTLAGHPFDETTNSTSAQVQQNNLIMCARHTISACRADGNKSSGPCPDIKVRARSMKVIRHMRGFAWTIGRVRTVGHGSTQLPTTCSQVITDMAVTSALQYLPLCMCFKVGPFLGAARLFAPTRKLGNHT